MSIQNKKAFLEHQKRDLVACHPSEREGRLLEIKELEQEIFALEKASMNKERIDELDNLLYELLKEDNLDDEVVSVIEKYTTINDGRLKLFKGI